MKVESLYVIAGSELGKYVSKWAEEKGVTINSVSYKSDDLNELLEGVLLFHNNYEISKEDEDVQDELGKRNIATHRVDLNGTLVATLSNVEMWLENHKPGSLLLLGEKNVVQHEHLEDFLNKI